MVIIKMIMISNKLLYLNNMAIFRPKQIINRYDELDIESLKDNFKLILLDIDNTIAIPNSGTCDQKAKNFINKLIDAGFKVVIFSNNTKKRVKHFIGDLNIDYIYLALKPLPFSYLFACLRNHVNPRQTIVLGDQLITDILGANLSCCYGIYTKRLVEKDSKTTARNRKIEKLIWRYILHEEV